MPSAKSLPDSRDLRAEYEKRKPSYQKIIHLVTLILMSAMERRKMKIHSFKQRVKDYSSFIEKIDRKHYGDPFMECTDMAGCRIICLFKSQVEEIASLIKEEFEVVEITDKRSSKKFDQFGYLSLHVIIKMPKQRLSFIECSGLDNLVCEIQIRTILQEAWAEIEHYLNYKAAKEERNEELVRKMFSLAGMFEVADSQFEEINKGFSNMVEKKTVSGQVVDQHGTTAIGLFKFCREKFRWFTAEWDRSQERKFVMLNAELKRLHLDYKGLESLMTKYSKEIGEFGQNYSPPMLIRFALALEYGKKYDLIVGIKGYSESVKKEYLNLSGS
jgi:ppGpp synthetase/RelA/SpoT-type nucleotidyltranferase